MLSGSNETDVLIVGAGPTGLLLANLLGAMGVRALIAERNETTVREPRAVSIDDESMRALQAAGLAESIGRCTVRGYGSIYRGPSGRVFAEVKPQSREYGFDKRNAFEQPVFEAVLRDALARRPSIDLRFGTELVAVSQDDQGVRATLRDATGERLVGARYMVACDGGRSFTRKTLGIPLEGSTFREPWLIIDLASTRNRCFHTEVFCDPRRSVITLPGPSGIRRYEFKLNAGETPEQAEAEAFTRKLLAEVGPDSDQPIRRRQVYTFHARVAEHWRQGRIFLAGDAAHLTPPFAGQGMNSGLRDAHNLAWKLAAALDMANPKALLDSYEMERKPHAWSMIELALRMGRVMMPASPLRGAVTRIGFRLLGLYRPARDYVAQMKYKPKPRFRAGLIEPDGRGARHTIVGRMIPQPLVMTPGREEMLLDAVLPDRPVVLILSEQPGEMISAADQARIEAAGAVVVGLTPEWINPIDGAFPEVRDRSRFFSELPYAAYLGRALLLRRDRYVAAAVPADDAASLIPMIARITVGRVSEPNRSDSPAYERRLGA